ncbi:MAG: hypothetical protein ACLFNN_00525 [Candidatus Paceibacterota bacterium]
METGRKPESGVFSLCGGGHCCPTVDFTDPNYVILEDDFGGQVKITWDQWSELKRSFFS